MNPHKIARLARTVRYLTPAQIGHRARLLALRTSYRRLPRLTQARYRWMAEEHPAGWSEWQCFPGADLIDTASASDALEEARDIAAGRYRFVNRVVELGPRPSWREHGQSQLWSYHLHYFDYLLSLGLWWKLEQPPEALETAAQLVTDWIEHNPPGMGDGWHPYVVAARLSNWLQGSELFGRSLREHPQVEPVLLRSIVEQILFLEQNLEFDVLGNHLLKNLRALVHAGLAVEHSESQRWLHQGALWTFDQVLHQILSDGGHYERSPMYQLQVFWDVLDILTHLRRVGITIPAEVTERFAAMLDWIAAMRHPDGDIPLLNDAVLGVAGTPAQALAAGAAFLGKPAGTLGWRGTALFGDLSPKEKLLHPSGEATVERASVPARLGSSQECPRTGTEARSTVASFSLHEDIALPDSGYYIFNSPKAWLVADAGDPCPDELPAHAHADALSFELSVSGQRIIVDAGVFEYQAGEWRDFMRGTAGHNTVMVDGQDQSEVWGSFRVGRRARVAARYWAEHDGLRVLEADHDGYQSTLDVRHRRWIARVDQRFFVVSDLLEGAGEHRALSFIHLHPDAVVGDASISDEARLIGAANGEAGLIIAPFGYDELDHYVGCLSSPRAWYSQHFGRRLPSTEVSLAAHGPIPRLWGYLLLLDSPTGVHVESESPTQHCIDLQLGDGAYVVRVTAAGIRIEQR
jgi:uncharacterized heparinase superfamily protein